MNGSDKAASPVLSDGDSFIIEMGELARARVGGVLPRGFILFEQKNGKWVGRHPRGEVKAFEREWVEAMLFLAAHDLAGRDITDCPVAP